MKQQQLNLFAEEKVLITERVKDKELREKHYADTFQASINAFYQTSFLNSGCIKSLKLAINQEELAIKEGLSVVGVEDKHSRLYRVKVTNQKEQTVENTLKERYKSFLRKYSNKEMVTVGQINIYLRGSKYKHASFIYNPRKKSFGQVSGYYLDGSRDVARFKVVVSAMTNKDDGFVPLLGFRLSTDWDETENLVYFNTKSELARFIKKTSDIEDDVKKEMLLLLKIF